MILRQSRSHEAAKATPGERQELLQRHFSFTSRLSSSSTASEQLTGQQIVESMIQNNFRFITTPSGLEYPQKKWRAHQPFRRLEGIARDIAIESVLEIEDPITDLKGKTLAEVAESLEAKRDTMSPDQYAAASVALLDRLIDADGQQQLTGIDGNTHTTRHAERRVDDAIADLRADGMYDFFITQLRYLMPHITDERALIAQFIKLGYDPEEIIREKESRVAHLMRSIRELRQGVAATVSSGTQRLTQGVTVQRSASGGA